MTIDEFIEELRLLHVPGDTEVWVDKKAAGTAEVTGIIEYLGTVYISFSP